MVLKRGRPRQRDAALSAGAAGRGGLPTLFSALPRAAASADRDQRAGSQIRVKSSSRPARTSSPSKLAGASSVAGGAAGR